MDNKITTVHVYQGSLGKYYKLADEPEKYHWKFPLDWALNHWLYDSGKFSGPKHCVECREKGSINDVFVGYCVTCYDNVYLGERGDRLNATTILEESCDIRELWRAFDYMRGDYWNTIGDPKELSYFAIEPFEPYTDYISISEHSNEETKQEQEQSVIPKPKLKHSRRSKLNQVVQHTFTLSLIHPSLLEEEPYQYQDGEPLRFKDLKKLAEASPTDYKPEPIQWPFTPPCPRRCK
jgi:hypothetical protein